jgi:streptogramin lyase
MTMLARTATLALMLLALAAPAAALAAPTISEFTSGLSANSSPDGITAGPDGNLWFTEQNSPGRIGRITPAGTITEFTAGLTANSFPTGIAAGPDGNLWFTEQNNPGRIGRITPTGTITEFTAGLTANSVPTGIAAGPDGNLWFTEAASPGRIGRITPTGTITEFSAGLSAGNGPFGIAAGPDGNLWFTELASRIGGITPAGTITEFTAGLSANSFPTGIAAGPDGNLWFTEFSNPGRIGRITAGPGVVTGAASGVTSNAAALSGSVRPNSQLTVFEFQYGTDTGYGSQTAAQPAGQDAAQHPVSAALSGLNPSTTYHYRLVATNSSDTTPGADHTFTTAPAAGGGNGGGGRPAPGGGRLAPAKPSFAGSPSSIRVDRKRGFNFSFHAGPGLEGRAAFKTVKKVRVSRTTRRKQQITLARKSFTVPASGRVILRARLSNKSFRILKLNHTIRTQITVTLSGATAQTSTASKTITLMAPKQRRR